MAGISGSLSDIDAIEREMFDDYNGEGPKHKDEEEFYGEMLADELLIEDYEPDLSDEDANTGNDERMLYVFGAAYD